MQTEIETMKEVKKTFEVEIIESERGWGQKVDERKYFKTAEDADQFCKEYNAKNNLPTVPDWYMYARRTN